MSITPHIHKTHRQYTNGLETIGTKGHTAGDCLAELCKRFPEMKNALFDRDGTLDNKIGIYLNRESTYPDELKKEVTSGDDIYITVMLAGG